MSWLGKRERLNSIVHVLSDRRAACLWIVQVLKMSALLQSGRIRSHTVQERASAFEGLLCGFQAGWKRIEESQLLL